MAKKDWTDKQIAFVEALFGDANGNLSIATSMAGYSEGSNPQTILKACKDLIIEHGNSVLAGEIPQAISNIRAVQANPEWKGAKTALDAAGVVFDRAGITKKVEKEDNTPQIQAILILPPKSDSVMKDVTPALQRLQEHQED